MVKIIGITGAVASGKSTFAAKLAKEFAQNSEKVEIISTDDFLFPNEVLIAKGILNNKGFPISYDRDRMRFFVQFLRAGNEVSTNIYSHKTYDITDNVREISGDIDILIIEGVGLIHVIDLLDEFIFLDTPIEVAFGRYILRVLDLRNQALTDDTNWYHQFQTMSESEFIERAEEVWNNTNLKNFNEYILPLKSQATRIV